MNIFLIIFHIMSLPWKPFADCILSPFSAAAHSCHLEFPECSLYAVSASRISLVQSLISCHSSVE